MKMSLKVKLIAAFFIFITIPLLVLGFLSYSKASNALEASKEAELNSISELTAQTMEESLQAVKNVIKTASFTQRLATYLQNQNENDQVTAFKYMQTS